MTKAALLKELEQLSSLDAETPPLSNAQRRELYDRLAHHRTHRDEPGVTLDDIRRKLTSR
jgi:hypothetical protein